VTDDGPGVEPAVRDAVFEPGRRGSDDGHLGAGLGLALARRLARAAGGDLQLTSGGAFEIRLPRVA
jgi:signal transduction histidine kinase